ncbi:hypothetical protein TIFTF001_034899 [Ficus carica]|uniref:Leucine-rich repeat-containing N-terminal plant-type domain-containing protein n=1 Tax=Ficus carica TaxID=3494 RepID=A0AA88J5S8_FICCA|nr:hypothetical protein TIFTF001_034899 [Ficus carica]
MHLNFGLSTFAPNVRCIEKERQALLRFKQGIKDEFGQLSSWGYEDAKKECCEWEGVRCSNETGYVVMLDLRGNDSWLDNRHLRGKISPSLMELYHLRYLDLSHNSFYGDIPYHLGNLSHLQYLNLGFNHNLDDVGNFQWITGLSNLEYLDLSFLIPSVRTDWLSSVSRLTKLSTLVLSGCSLHSPSLSTLSHINMSTSLSTVFLESNSLNSSIFQWLFNSSTNLVFLDLSFNELYGSIPYSLGKTSGLTYLDLGWNYLEGEIPESFGNLCNLKALHLYRNNLRGQLTFFQNLSSCDQRPSIERIHLHTNNFSGPLPDFSFFPSLKAISLSNNKLNGNLAKAGIGNLSEKLEVLDVSLNILGGEISGSHLSNLSKLTWLGLSSTLKIKSNWIPPFQLRALRLRSCKLQPPYLFPNWLKNQSMLSDLDISDLGISDAIPIWFQNLISNNMFFLNISKNQIHGTFPASPSISKLFALDLSSNNLVGTLPRIQSDLLCFLDVSNNQFSGSLLPLCSITLSQYMDVHLDLSNNQLSGVIPDNCPSHWGMTTLVSLANNRFSGKIPRSIGSLRALETLDLHNNSFSGELPSSMRELQFLKFMNLGGNKLSGKVPAWIGNRLSDLKILILSSNMFDGSISSSLCMLTNLQILDLSHNNMHGIIPQCLYNFTAMAHNANSSELELLQLSSPLVLASSDRNEPEIIISWSYMDKATVSWRGRSDEYGRNLVFLRLIDLSSNRLSGNFPNGILNLSGLVALNLSRNNLSGRLPQDIGQLNQLQSLDLSWNRFSGEIPTSMSDLHFLSHLDLSYNNLSGKIPSGTQLQGFNASVYAGNEELCGPPLANNCSTNDDQGNPAQGGQRSTHDHESSEDEFMKWLFIGMGSGFTVGFWGVCLVLFFNRACRHAFFLFFNNLVDFLLVRIAIYKARLLRTGI